MSNRLFFVVEGEPVAKERPRFSAKAKKDGSSFVRTYTPPATTAFEQRVGILCKIAANRSRWSWTDGCRFAVIVRVFRKYEGKGGDLDNYAKAVLDGINKIAFADDRYVRRIEATIEEPDAKRPRVEVVVVRMAKEAA